MSDFAGMEDLLQDFLVEAGDLLSGVDNKLVDLERNPRDLPLLNEIFRGFHTIKGGAGFLNASALVHLCHLTENLFDKLRTNELQVTPEMLDVILGATASVRTMFDDLERAVQPAPADPALLEQLTQALTGALKRGAAAPKPVAPISAVKPAPAKTSSAVVATAGNEPDWDAYYHAVTGIESVAAQLPVVETPFEDAEEPHLDDVVADQIIVAAVGRRTTDKPGYQGPAGGRREGERQRDNSIRVDTSRLDQVLNLSGEIGLTKNRLTALRSDILNGKNDTDTLHALDLAVSQLDLLVSDLQNAVMKTFL